MRKSHKQKVADRRKWKRWDRFHNKAAKAIAEAIDSEFLIMMKEKYKNENRDSEKRNV